MEVLTNSSIMHQTKIVMVRVTYFGRKGESFPHVFISIQAALYGSKFIPTFFGRIFLLDIFHLCESIELPLDLASLLSIIQYITVFVYKDKRNFMQVIFRACL